MSLYIAILNAILLRYLGATSLQEAFHTLYSALETEKKHLRRHDLWSERVPQPPDLLFESV